MNGKVFTIEKTAVAASIMVETDTKKFDQHNPKANKCMLPRNIHCLQLNPSPGPQFTIDLNFENAVKSQFLLVIMEV